MIPSIHKLLVFFFWHAIAFAIRRKPILYVFAIASVLYTPMNRSCLLFTVFLRTCRYLSAKAVFQKQAQVSASNDWKPYGWWSCRSLDNCSTLQGRPRVGFPGSSAPAQAYLHHTTVWERAGYQGDSISRRTRYGQYDAVRLYPLSARIAPAKHRAKGLRRIWLKTGATQVPHRCHIGSVPLSYFGHKRRFKDVKNVF